MQIHPCDLCPLTFLTKGELASHKLNYDHRSTSASISTSFQPNQQGTERSLQIDHLRVFNSALTPGSEVLLAANAIYWMSRGKRCAGDCDQPLLVKLEPSDGPPSAKKSRGTSGIGPLVKAATSKQEYPCNECEMVFASYHALGGHKSGHRKAEAKLRAIAAQTNQVIPHPQPQPQLQPQEPPPPPPPSSQQEKYLFDLNEPAPEQG